MQLPCMHIAYLSLSSLVLLDRDTQGKNVLAIFPQCNVNNAPQCVPAWGSDRPSAPWRMGRIYLGREESEYFWAAIAGRIFISSAYISREEYFQHEKQNIVWSTGSSEAFLEYTGSPSSLPFCRMICKLTSGSHTSSKSNCKEIKIASNKKWNTAAAITPKVVWVLRHHITKMTSCSPGHSSFDVEGGIWAGDGCQVVSG